MKKVIRIMEMIMIVCIYMAIGITGASAYVDYGYPLVIVAGGMTVVILVTTTIVIEFHKAFWG